MINIKYGSKNWNIKSTEEIEAGRPVVIQIFGRRKDFIYKLLSSYAEYSQLPNDGRASRKLFFDMGWRSMLAPSIMGICVRSRTLGMAMTVTEEGAALEVRFQKPVNKK